LFTNENSEHDIAKPAVIHEMLKDKVKNYTYHKLAFKFVSFYIWLMLSTFMYVWCFPEKLRCST